jgi:hypothetical protein
MRKLSDSASPTSARTIGRARGQSEDELRAVRDRTLRASGQTELRDCAVTVAPHYASSTALPARLFLLRPVAAKNVHRPRIKRSTPRPAIRPTRTPGSTNSPVGWRAWPRRPPHLLTHCEREHRRSCAGDRRRRSPAGTQLVDEGHGRGIRTPARFLVEVVARRRPASRLRRLRHRVHQQRRRARIGGRVAETDLGGQHGARGRRAQLHLGNEHDGANDQRMRRQTIPSSCLCLPRRRVLLVRKPAQRHLRHRRLPTNCRGAPRRLAARSLTASRSMSGTTGGGHRPAGRMPRRPPSRSPSPTSPSPRLCGNDIP